MAHLVTRNDAPTAAAHYAVAVAPGSIRTSTEGRTTGPNQNHQMVDVRVPGYNYRGKAFQRIEATHHLSAADNNAARANPNVKIPMSWWHTFLPRAIFNRTDPAGLPLNKHLPANKQAATALRHGLPNRAPQLETQDNYIPAPSQTHIVDAGGNEHQVMANAVPQLLYPTENTSDNAHYDKKCTYGQIRDPSTHKWRCIRNPNHHDTDG